MNKQILMSVGATLVTLYAIMNISALDPVAKILNIDKRALFS